MTAKSTRISGKSDDLIRRDMDTTYTLPPIQFATEEQRHQNRGPENRHGQQDLKRGLRSELNGNGLPVGGREQRAPLEEMLQVQIDFTIAPVYSEDSS